MKIHSMQIQKFRSIDDSTILFRQILAIVGANNEGKETPCGYGKRIGQGV